MTDVKADMKSIVDAVHRQHNHKPYEDEDFAKLRAHVRGTLIAAHRQLIGDEWQTNDDRILDIIDTWMNQKRGK
jgi:hypothetical protein